MNRSTRTVTLAAVSFVVALLVGACGSSETAETSAPPTISIITSATAVTTTAPTAEWTEESTAGATVVPTESSTAARNVDVNQFSDGVGGVSWISPTGNVWCRIAAETYASGCQSLTAPVPDGADCDMPPFSVDELSKGFFLFPDRVQPMCFNQGVFAVNEFRKVLEYDTSISSAGYTCTSRSAGMTCTTGNGHGFELSAEIARGF